MDKQEVGRLGERLAAEYLAANGFTILDRNWRSRQGAGAAPRASGERQNHGELDIVAQHGTTLVGVEVKTRSSSGFGDPAAAISPEKVARLKRLFGQWLVEHRREYRATEVRLDAVGVLLRPGWPSGLGVSGGSGGCSPMAPTITHYRGIS